MDNHTEYIPKMDSNSIIEGSKINSAEIIEYAKNMIENWNEEYKGAAPGEFDTDIAKKMSETINSLIKAALKFEALQVLSKLPTSDDETTREIASAIDGLMRN